MRPSRAGSTRAATARRAAAPLIVLLAVLPAAARAQAAPHAHGAGRTSADTAFTAVQARGGDPRGMGVDQTTSVHRFDALPDGGRIEFRHATDAPTGIARIRAHLRRVAAAFAAGDFRTPAFVHGRTVPGTAVMAARRAAISYAVRDLPRGGEVRITTRNPEALRAVHQFIAFQRRDHRAGGAGTPADSAPRTGPAHTAHPHPGHRMPE